MNALTRRTVLRATAATAALGAPAAIAGLPALDGSSPIADLVRLYHETSQHQCEARERADIAHFEIRRRFPEIPDNIKMDIGDPNPLYIPIDPKNIERRRDRLVKRSRWSEAAAAQWAEETERTRWEYEAACTAIEEATEWPELDRRADELLASLGQIEDSIIAARPQSLAELATKLRFAASLEGYTDLDEDEEESDRSARFFRSIICDVEQLAGGAA
jgi:hypothetical protein